MDDTEIWNDKRSGMKWRGNVENVNHDYLERCRKYSTVFLFIQISEKYDVEMLGRTSARLDAVY